MFLNARDFPFTKSLEASWLEIFSEYQSLSSGDLKPWHEKRLYNHGWSVFGFYAFGKKIEKNCTVCPRTAQALEKVPGLMTAGFSILRPGTVIKPHHGYSGAVLRCHLGILSPSGAGIRVAGEVRNWEAGKAFVFDDTSLHEAWNHGLEDRVVLLLDFLRPGHRLGLSDQIKNYFLWILAPK